MISNIPKETTIIELDDYLKETFKGARIEKVIYSYDIYEIVENLRLKKKFESLIEQKTRSDENSKKSKENLNQKKSKRF